MQQHVGGYADVSLAVLPGFYPYLHLDRQTLQPMIC